MFREGCVFPVFYVHDVRHVAFWQVCVLALEGIWLCGMFHLGDGDLESDF